VYSINPTRQNCIKVNNARTPGVPMPSQPRSFDQHLYIYWPRVPRSPDGDPNNTADAKNPLTRLVNTDSVECALKALDVSKRQPYAFALPREDDRARLPCTDDLSAACATLVTTNFETCEAAVTFLDDVCRGTSPRFRTCEELLAVDTPRKPSVIVICAPAPNAADTKRQFMKFLPSLLTGMAAAAGKRADRSPRMNPHWGAAPPTPPPAAGGYGGLAPH